MSDDATVVPIRDFVQLSAEMRETYRHLNVGGGGGNSGGMEARVAKLEADVAHLVKQADKIDARLTVVGTDLGTIKTDLAVLKATSASKGFIVTALSLGSATIIAVLTVLSKLGILAAG
jgi:hypothetical protein